MNGLLILNMGVQAFKIDTRAVNTRTVKQLYFSLKKNRVLENQRLPRQQASQVNVYLTY